MPAKSTHIYKKIVEVELASLLLYEINTHIQEIERPKYIYIPESE